MMNTIPDKKRKPFTIKKNILYQYVFFPLLFTAMLLVPLGFYAFIHFFIGVHARNNVLNTILFTCVSVCVAFLVGFILAKGVRSVAQKTGRCNRLAVLLSPAVNAVTIFIAYVAGGIYAAKIAAYVVNPLFIIANLMFDFVLENSIVMIMFLSGLAYMGSFLLFTRKAFAVEEKERVKTFRLITALVTALALASCTFAVYPDIEYEVLKKTYETLPFTDEVDYKFYENLPFEDDNKLVKMPLTLDFSDVATTPRLDGATAFYPVYAAVAENCYSGLKSEMEKNDLHFYGDRWGPPNISLNFSFAQQNDPVLTRCAELINCTQTTNAYNGLANGRSDVVFAFEPSDAQIAYAAERGVEFERTLIGYDAFCFFVNTKNPVNNLTYSQVQGIYSGKITNWRRVGGKNRRIFAFTRPKNSGSQTVMENTVMKGVSIETRFEAKEVRTMGMIINYVNSYLNAPTAIGYTFMYYSSFMVTGESIKYLAIDGVAPTPDTVRTGAYMFSTPFYAVTVKGRQTAETLELIDWLQGTQGQRLIEKCGYVGL